MRRDPRLHRKRALGVHGGGVGKREGNAHLFVLDGADLLTENEEITSQKLGSLCYMKFEKTIIWNNKFNPRRSRKSTSRLSKRT